MFRRKKEFSRRTELDAAMKDMSRGRPQRAIGHFRTVLEHQPDDSDTHLKIAPLLAREKEPEEAWRHFVAAADGYAEKGFTEKALSVYRQATSSLPERDSAWERVADLELQRHHRPDAVRVLCEGSRALRKRRRRAAGVSLLRKALRLAPDDFEIAFELAGELAKVGRRSEAVTLLEGLTKGQRGVPLRRLRKRLFRMRPTPARAWHWCRAVLWDK